MEIIPAIDIIDGKCVRLTRGDYSQKKIYNEDPLEVAKQFEDAGLARLHLVDLDGARAKAIVNYSVLETIASKTSLHVDFGGGVQSDDDLRIAFECGARQVTGGSIAVKSPEVFEQWLRHYGPDKIILGADVHEGTIAVSGWQEASAVRWQDFLERYVEKEVKYVISTDVSKDGVLEGPSLDLYKEMKDRFADLHIIASGGVANMDDLERLAELNVYGVIVGKAIYEGRIPLKDLARFGNNTSAQ
jgi:phosphoribosylformimino-5-aminoimidazole carboxamide ribotide isomerase